MSAESRQLAEVARRWIHTALRGRALQEVPETTLNELDIHRRADLLYAISADFDVPIEETVRWIQSDEFTPKVSDWAEHCAWYAKQRRTTDRVAAPN